MRNPGGGGELGGTKICKLFKCDPNAVLSEALLWVEILKSLFSCCGVDV